jgi:hypothetical protein
VIELLKFVFLCQAEALPMPKLKRISLEPWEEAVGIFKGIEYGDYEVSLLLGDCRIVFPADSPEASILKSLGRRLVSKRIGVLRTDDPQKPLLIRRLKSELRASWSQ